MLVASLPCAPCTHFGSYISIFLSFVAVDERCVCSVYPIWGHQSYMYREGSAFYKILAVIFGFQSTTVNAEFFFNASAIASLFKCWSLYDFFSHS